MRPITYANVTATVALFIALGGTSYAALTITGKHVKNGSLTGVDLKPGSITAKQIKPRSITANRLAKGVGVGPQGPAGPQGVAGAQGPQGLAGPGSAAVNSTEIVGPLTAGSSSGQITLKSTAQCPPGQRAVAGGIIDQDGSLSSSRRSPDGTAWEVLGTSTAPRVAAIAYCA